jgi:hypothetical protein
MHMFDGTDAEAAAESLRDAVDAVLALDPCRMPTSVSIELLRRLETQSRRLASAAHRVVSDVDERGVAGELCYPSTAAVLHDLLHVSPREAQARVAAARELTVRHDLTGGVLAASLPATSAALAAGSISGAHAAVISRFMNALPAGLDRDYGAALESCLAEHATELDPQQVAQAATRLLARLNRDGVEPTDEDNSRRRGCTLRKHADGSSDLSGHFTAANTAVWEAILDCLAAPVPSDADGEPDDRTPAQRRHDAMSDAGLRLLNSGRMPDCGGTPVTVTVTMNGADLHAGAGYGTTAHNGLISIPDLLNLAAEAEIIPVVLNDAGGVLSYGRTRRIASPAQRRALAARDRGCSHPGCTRPPAWCQVHHIKRWIDGGLTDIGEMCLLCGYHHREFEKRGWRCLMLDAVPHWLAPPWLDPEQVPRRNVAHHVDIAFDTTAAPAPSVS